MIKRILRKLVEAVLSAFMLGIMMAVIYYQPPQEGYPEAPDFEGIFQLVFMVSIFIFIIGGIPASILIESIMRSINFRYRAFAYLLHPALYIFAGLLAGVLFALLIGIDLDGRIIIVPSLIGGACFYAVSLGMGTVIKIFKEQGHEE
ncbi:hypothetical protein [Oceanobacillus sp. CFH 90083]|uniref:hypothetical protein n=1 Tax=Oceanobacillus sp. CFH 90083 TaxID=2592336 RepID=UPI00128C9EDD|nr:hypothetical protein [Oceanobacillus sp. CFH 90083]